MTDLSTLPGPWLVHLEITHFRFSIGGEHYYGELSVKLKGRKNGKGTRYSSEDARLHPESIKLSRKLVSEKECAYLCKKDGDALWEIGMSTQRFNSEDDVKKAAIHTFSENFDPTADLLMIYDGPYCEPIEVIAGEASLVKRLNSMEWEEQEEFFRESGFAFIADKDEVIECHET